MGVVVMRVVGVRVVVAALRVSVLERGRNLDGVMRGRDVARMFVELLIPPSVHVAEHEGHPLSAQLGRHRRAAFEPTRGGGARLG